VDGGLGVSLCEPGQKIELRPAGGFSVKGAAPLPDELLDAASSAYERLHEALGVGGATVNVERMPLPHSGLGSTTQFLLGMAAGMCELYEVEATVRSLAAIIRRGGTSGIGVAAFEKGGFIVDGGHRFGPGGKTDFRSSDTSIVPPAPVIFQRSLPADWRWVCIVPSGQKVTGNVEEDIFSTRCPVPLAEVREIAHIVLMRAMPAVVEGDIEALGAVLTRLQEAGFKRFEVENQPEYVRGLMRAMRDGGATGAGMSSFGPLVYGLCGKDEAKDVRGSGEDYMQENGIGFEAFISATDNGKDRLEFH